MILSLVEASRTPKNHSPISYSLIDMPPISRYICDRINLTKVKSSEGWTLLHSYTGVTTKPPRRCQQIRPCPVSIDFQNRVALGTSHLERNSSAASLTVKCPIARPVMSISDKIVGVVLLLISAIIFVYYSVWFCQEFLYSFARHQDSSG